MYQLMNRSFSGRARGVFGLVVAMVLLGACATAPVAPTASLTEAREAIASAEQAGARQHADAELDEAQQQLLKAERFVKSEQMVEAERFAHQALIAAELASARTEAAKAVAINREMRRSADALLEEMRRTGDQQ